MNKFQRWKNIMKAVPFEEKRLNKWQPPYICQPKYDGVRCRAIPIESTGEFILLSSEENVIYSVPHINKALSTLQLRAELDGELYCHNMKFEEIVSITSRTVNLHPNSPVMDFHIFDIVNPLPQMKRTVMIENLRNLHRSIKVAPFYVCENLDDIMKTYDSIINLGYEGIIVRHSMGAYERKRSTLVMKFKPKQEDEYEITGWQEEVDNSGNPKDSLGSLTCISGDGNTFSVGTGFSSDDRRMYWQKRDRLIGRVCKIKYQHLTTGKKVPRFPVFVEVIE
uniref:Polydeoxyribonucleotide synthase [ATP] n=1 Tax=viral metagenome TaxID=1070528 RepID=A0A6M3JSV7_9ZZZZ